MDYQTGRQVTPSPSASKVPPGHAREQLDDPNFGSTGCVGFMRWKQILNLPRKPYPCRKFQHHEQRGRAQLGLLEEGGSADDGKNGAGAEDLLHGIGV